MLPVDGKLIIGTTGSFPVGAGTDVTMSSVHEGKRPFQPISLVIPAGAGWLVKSLKVQRQEQLAYAGVPAERFGGDGAELVLPIVLPFQVVDVVMTNSTTETRDAPHVELHGRVL